MKKLICRLLGVIAILTLAVLLVLLDAHPVMAQENKVNYTYGELRYHDFANKDLVGGVFAAADLVGANFQGANLSKAIFTKATLEQANLTEANLTDALIDRVSLEGANLTNAIFIDATATSTNFTDAIITGVDFSGAILDRYQTYLLCQRADGINPVTSISTKDSLGCR